MNIFYYCPTGVHTSLVAAGLHLGMLGEEFTPDRLSKLPFFDSLAREGVGMLRFVGTDEYENSVYTLGVSSEEELVIKSIHSLMNVCHIPTARYHLVGASHYVHPWTKLGCMLNRLGFAAMGKPLLYQGISKNYHRLRDLVGEVKAFAGKSLH